MPDSVPSNTTTQVTLQLGTPYLGALEHPGDTDWVRIALTAGLLYRFSLSSAVAQGIPDPYLRLYDAAGVLIAEDDDSGTGLDSELRFTPSVTDVYYLSASDYSAALGAYSLLAQVLDDYPNTVETDGVILPNGLATAGTIENAGDADAFRVDLVAGMSYRFTVTGSGAVALSDPIFELYNDALVQVARNDDAAPGNLFPRADFTATVSGTYYALVYGYQDLVGDYLVRATPLVTDDYSATRATTGRVLVNGPAVTGALEVVGDHDYFRVSLVAGVTYQMRLEGAANNGVDDTFLTLRDHLGNVLVTNDDGGGNRNSLIVFTATRTGFHYLDAGAFENRGSGNYQIAVQALDDYAGNTTTTGLVAVNGPATTGRIEVAGDRDYFKVQLNAGVQYEFVLRKSVGGLTDPFLELRSPTGALLRTDDDAAGGVDARILFTPTVNGVYHLVARDHQRGLGAYTITATVSGDDYRDTIATTGLAVINGSVTGVVNFAADNDWFRVNLTAGREYTVQLLGAPSGSPLTLADPYLRGIHDSAGALITGTANDDFGTSRESRVVFTPMSTGQYFISAGGYGAGLGAYRLAISETVVADVPGNNTSTATLAVGGRQTGVISPAADEDWFALSLVGGTPYILDLIGDPASQSPLADPLIRGVYSAAGVLLPNTTNDDYGTSRDARVTFTAPSSGTFFVSAAAFSTYTGDYVLSLSRRVNQLDTVGETPATAAPLALGSTGVSGIIDLARDVDWYAVSLVAGQSYLVSIRGAASGAGTLSDTRLAGIFDSTGTLIAGSGYDGAPGSAEVFVVLTPASTATYYIAVAGQGDLSGTYRVSVELTQASTEIPADATTQAFIDVGAVFLGSLETAGDRDWVRASLTAGVRYQIRLEGQDSAQGTLADPLLAAVFGPGGQALPGVSNDDFAGTHDAQLTFVAPTTGTYFIELGAFGVGTGTYRLVLNTAAASDTTAPVLLGSSPVDGATGIPLNGNLTLSFNERIRAGAGDIVIAGGNQTLRIPVTSSEVSFSGTSAIVNPAQDFLSATAYTVTFAEGVILDDAGNAFAGISDTTQLNFTTATETSVDDWTVMVYIAADNDLEPFSIDDLNEMESVFYGANVNVVVLLDRSPGYDASNGNWSGTRRGLVTHDDNLAVISSALVDIGEKNTGNPATLTDFINWGAANYAAQNYALVVWDHGGGLSGACWDNTSNGDNLSANELRTAIDNAQPQLDFIGYDACSMGMLEVVWDLVPLAEVVVASQELIPGPGWAYDRWLASLTANPGMSAVALGQAAVDTYGAEYAGQSNITLSALTTVTLTPLKQALDDFVASALLATGADLAAMRLAAERTKDYGAQFAQYTLDLGDFMAEVAARVSSATLRAKANAVLSNLQTAVYAETGTVGEATGLSIYLPWGSAGTDAGYTAANHGFVGVSAWEDFIALV